MILHKSGAVGLVRASLDGTHDPGDDQINTYLTFMKRLLFTMRLNSIADSMPRHEDPDD